MKPGMLFLLLLSACTYHLNGHHYTLTWICLSPEGCERTEQVALIDRMFLNEDLCDFSSTKDAGFSRFAELVASDSLPADCSLLYGFALFGHELEPSRFCHTAEGFVLELSIPNRDPATHSQWLVDGRDVGRVESGSAGNAARGAP